MSGEPQAAEEVQAEQAEASAPPGAVTRAMLRMGGLMCKCKNCPTYPDENELRFYCYRGASSHPIEMKGCLCPGCPTQKMMRLTGNNYCFYGAAKKGK